MRTLLIGRKLQNSLVNKYATTLMASLLLTISSLGQNTQGPIPNLQRHPQNLLGLPAFEKVLPKGATRVALENPSHFDGFVQVRSGNKAAQFYTKGKAVTVLYLPDGDYTVFFLLRGDRFVRIGRSFNVSNDQTNFFDSKGRRVNEQGKRINEDGELIDSKGRLIDEQGKLIDESGNRIDSKGRLLDKNGKPVK